MVPPHTRPSSAARSSLSWYSRCSASSAALHQLAGREPDVALHASAAERPDTAPAPRGPAASLQASAESTPWSAPRSRPRPKSSFPSRLTASWKTSRYGPLPPRLDRGGPSSTAYQQAPTRSNAASHRRCPGLPPVSIFPGSAGSEEGCGRTGPGWPYIYIMWDILGQSATFRGRGNPFCTFPRGTGGRGIEREPLCIMCDILWQSAILSGPWNPPSLRQAQDRLYLSPLTGEEGLGETSIYHVTFCVISVVTSGSREPSSLRQAQDRLFVLPRTGMRD